MKYLYEMHTHIKGVSTCASCDAEKIAELYVDSDYSGIVVTDHINTSTFRRSGLTDSPWDEKMDHYLKGYKELKKAVDGKLNVILGIEICFYCCDENDYLVYGVTEEFLRSHGDLMAYTPEEFSKLAHENGLLMLQAHPFRRDSEVSNWKILDGYEIFNGNPRHYSCNPMAEAWAKYHNKSIVTSGSDLHEIEDAYHGGIYFEKEIKTSQELVEELKKGNYTLKKDKFKHTREE